MAEEKSQEKFIEFIKKEYFCGLFVRSMAKVKFYTGIDIPLEFHRARVVQKINLLPIDERYEAIKKGGFNTYRIDSKSVFLDMLTDSGTNAMSDLQLSAMMRADDAYAGSETFARLEDAVLEVLGKRYVVPAHQGRAAENVIMRALLKQGDVVPMNYHFGSTINHITLNGGRAVELVDKSAFISASNDQFKGNVQIDKLVECIEEVGVDHIPFIRMEASTNLIGGQPFSMTNYKEVRKVADKYGLRILLDATLLAENALLIIEREEQYKEKSLSEIIRMMCDLADIVYFSARKFTCTRGAVICTDNYQDKLKMDQVVAVFEGYVTYGGMSMKEIEAMIQGLYEATDEEYVSQSPSFIKFFVEEAVKRGIPMVTPPGVLGAHIDAKKFCEHIPVKDYPASAVAAGLYLCSGIRAMEGGTASEVSATDPTIVADMELVRIAFPRKVFTLSQAIYALDRLQWLYDNRELLGPMAYDDIPGMTRCFRTPLKPLTDWPERLIAKFKEDLGDR